MTLQDHMDSLYNAIEVLEQKVKNFKIRLELEGIDSFRAEEAVLQLDSARNSLSNQTLTPRNGWTYCTADLEGEFPF